MFQFFRILACLLGNSVLTSSGGMDVNYELTRALLLVCVGWAAHIEETSKEGLSSTTEIAGIQPESKRTIGL